MKIIPGLNYLLHGMNENCCRDVIRQFTKNASDAIFFPWTTPDFDKSSLHHYADVVQKKFAIDFFNDANTKSSWADILKVGKKKDNLILLTLHNFLCSEKNRYIILDAVHVMAHIDASPNKYYQELLAICNFHTLTNNIYFIISCSRVPVIFHKENPLRHLWKFHACENLNKVTEESPENRHCLNRFVENLLDTPSPQVFEKMEHRCILSADGKEYLPIHKGNVDDFDSDLCDAVNGAFESLSLFNSTEVYLLENIRPSFPTETTMKVDELAKVLVGQEEAAQRLIDRVLSSRNPVDPDAIRHEKKPRGVFLFVGPSGVGKTQISQELAHVLPDYKFVQVNLAEYQDKESVNKLIGIGRGYVDSDQGGILTEPVRRHSKYVLLFDELDQAHSSVGQLFYKIFEGEVTDGRGRQVSFRDCYIIMTSNKGVLAESSQLPPVERSQLIEQALKTGVTDADKLKFTDAFLGRIDDTIPFRPLSVEDLAGVARIYFEAKIEKPYAKIPITNFVFVPELSGADTPGGSHPLIAQGIIDPKSLFFEMWALFAGHENPQGARQLFRIMDDYLIRPLEFARIKSPTGVRDKELHFLFQPVMLDDLNFDEATIVVIDDKPEEVQYIKATFPEQYWKVRITDFDNNTPVQDAQVILLDLYKNEGKGSVPVEISIDKKIEEIRKINQIAPIILHTSLSTGLRCEQLKNEKWRSGVFGYLPKDEANTVQLKEVVHKAVRAYHANAKKMIALTKFSVKQPKSYDGSTLIFEYSYEQRTNLHNPAADDQA
jgi:DNA polymerase III delta prime subunit